jgi:hypothetical protein
LTFFGVLAFELFLERFFLGTFFSTAEGLLCRFTCFLALLCEPLEPLDPALGLRFFTLLGPELWLVFARLGFGLLLVLARRGFGLLLVLARLE